MPFDRPLPIAIVIPSFQPGGTERQMIELVRRLDSRRWTVHVACFATGGPWFDRAAEFAASIGSFPISGFAKSQTLAQARRFVHWCREHEIAVVHTTDLYSNIFFLPAAAAAAVPVRIGSRREVAAGKSLAQLALQRAAYGCAHAIVANADAVGHRLRREGVPARRITIVPNGLDCGRHASRVLVPPLRRVAMVANLRPGKGHDTLIDAAAITLRRFPEARFDLIGDGTERSALEALVTARGLSHAITFAGHVEDVAARLRNADVFTLPSESEAFPNAVLEAMAAGLPVVATAVGGIKEVVEHHRTGLLVEPRNPLALADALCRLFTAPHEARALAAAGRAVVESRYSFERMVASIEHLYDQQLARRAPKRAVQQSQFASF
ncbi:MAG TPA: glycosyltransferase [Vicinamibacterales bacterium]|nr:glycosyltransferase [Vicinamibacterales bacterium]